MNQLDLFGDPPAQRHSETSKAAAEEIKPTASTLRQRVYEFLDLRYSYGATDEEIQLALEMNPSTQRPRRIELLQAGRVRDSGRKRPTTSGRAAVVWVCSEVPADAPPF